MVGRWVCESTSPPNPLKGELENDTKKGSSSLNELLPFLYKILAPPSGGWGVLKN